MIPNLLTKKYLHQPSSSLPLPLLPLPLSSLNLLPLTSFGSPNPLRTFPTFLPAPFFLDLFGLIRPSG